MSLLTSQNLTIVADPGTSAESRTNVLGRVDGRAGYFPIDTPVNVGNVIEWPDPRGGTLRMKVTKVTVYDGGSSAVNHVKVVLRDF